jgi:hypothetical protein
MLARRAQFAVRSIKQHQIVALRVKDGTCNTVRNSRCGTDNDLHLVGRQLLVTGNGFVSVGTNHLVCILPSPLLGDYGPLVTMVASISSV